MSRSRIRIFLVLSLAFTGNAVCAEDNPVAREPHAATSPESVEVIVKLKADASGQSVSKMRNGLEKTEALAKRTGLQLKFNREVSDELLAGSVLARGDVNDALERLRADPSVEFVSRDHRRFAHATNPNDSLFNGQWYLKATEASAVNAIGAWDREKGLVGVVVAVLDTGVLFDHPDLARGDAGGKLLPGYDFVTGAPANDGGGRDNDPSDPGDWIDDSDKTNSAFTNCDVTGSSWHGTRVAGMIGALTNNNAGVAGMSWNSFLLPVRVLGKCGGTDSDILAAMRWSAGLHVNGVPDNPTPARILNLSLGSSSPCEDAYLFVINELTALKVLVVISAGNEGTVVSSPGNCPGVAAIAAIRHAGSKVGFSNLGPEVALGAPGGNCVNVNGGPCLFSLDTTSNNGTKSPGGHIYTDQINSNLGTSFSAPIVSGVAALMLSRNANLSTAQLLSRLREGAVAYPTSVAGEPGVGQCHVPVDTNDTQLEQCICTAATCGAGMVNAMNSVEAADRPIAAIALPVNVSPGQNVSLNGTGSAASCNRTLATFSWTVISPVVNPPTIQNAATASATVLAPTSGTYTLRLTVTDSQGRIDAADVVIEPNRATSAAPGTAGSGACMPAITSGPTPGGSVPVPTPTPSGTGSRGGGGGSFDVTTLGLLGLTLLITFESRRRQRIFRCICEMSRYIWPVRH